MGLHSAGGGYNWRSWQGGKSLTGSWHKRAAGPNGHKSTCRIHQGAAGIPPNAPAGLRPTEGGGTADDPTAVATGPAAHRRGSRAQEAS